MTTTKHKWTVEQWVEHGREWLAAGWTWSAGQIAIASWPEDDGSVEYERCIVPWGGFRVLDNVVPDMRDAGTRGHALALVQVEWGENCTIDINHVDDDGDAAVQVFVARAGEFLCYPCEPTIHEALLAARKSAPSRSCKPAERDGAERAAGDPEATP